MKRTSLIILLIILSGTLGVSLLLNKMAPAQYSATSPPQNWPTQTNNEGEVEVTVTPLTLSPPTNTWSFQLIFNTHTVELSQDLLQKAFLEWPGEERQPPLAWEGDPPGGHHRQGVLRFPPPKISKGEEFTLILQNIGGTFERKFTWKEVKK